MGLNPKQPSSLIARRLKPISYFTVGFYLLIGSAGTSARLRVGDQPTRYLVDRSGDRSTHRLVDLDTLLVDYHNIGRYLPENW